MFEMLALEHGHGSETLSGPDVSTTRVRRPIAAL